MKKFNHTAHKELWDWLARNPDKGKEDWPGWKETAMVEAECFACQYVTDNFADTLCSGVCPLIWENTKYSCMQSYYYEWTECFIPEDRAVLAAKIRDLPLREGVNCE